MNYLSFLVAMIRSILITLQSLINGLSPTYIFVSYDFLYFWRKLNVNLKYCGGQISMYASVYASIHFTFFFYTTQTMIIFKLIFDLPTYTTLQCALNKATVNGNAYTKKIAYSCTRSERNRAISVQMSINDNSLCQLSRCCSCIYVY